MPTTDIPPIAIRGTILEAVDRLELGPDPASAPEGGAHAG
jgi:hypothetical protein